MANQLPSGAPSIETAGDPRAVDPSIPQGTVTGMVSGSAATSVSDSVFLQRTRRYEFLDEIAHGGMGVVYRATDQVLDRGVAIKVLHERFAPDSAAARRFVDEAKIAGQLQHPAIPAVHDLGTLPDGRPFLAMKLVKGRTLDELLKDRPDVAHERGRFIAIFEQVCQAVGYAHDHKVIHRDLKPANVMVGGFGEVQVMDWGLAKVLTPGAVASSRLMVEPTATIGTEIRSMRDSDGSLTQAGSVLGTPAFMSPEQAGGEIDKIDERADVFGLGAILCVILTGEPPYRGGDAETIRLQAIRGKLGDAFARLDSGGAEPGLVTLAKSCLGEYEHRPTNAGQVADAVARLRADADERARQAEVDRAAIVVREAEQRKRRNVWYGLAAALGLGTVVAAGLAIRAHRAEGRAIELSEQREKARAEAVASEERTREAEEARRQELGKTAAAAAQLAAGRGHWADALKLYDTALEINPGNIPVELGRIDARMALGQVRAAIAELETLAARADLGPHAGPVWLRKAEMALWRKSGNGPRELAKEAIAKGLPPADREYAQVFVVDNADEAIRHLQEAIRVDPFHSRSLEILAPLAFVTGRKDLLRESVTQLRLSRRIRPTSCVRKSTSEPWTATGPEWTGRWPS